MIVNNTQNLNETYLIEYKGQVIGAYNDLEPLNDYVNSLVNNNFIDSTLIKMLVYKTNTCILLDSCLFKNKDTESNKVITKNGAPSGMPEKSGAFAPDFKAKEKIQRIFPLPDATALHKLKIEGTRDNNLFNGSYKEYYDNGQLHIEGTCNNNIFNGSYKEYFKNGNLNIDTYKINGVDKVKPN